MSSVPLGQGLVSAARPGTVYLVGAGPGDPGLLTLRAAELLASADVVLHDELVDEEVVRLATGTAEYVGKRGTDLVNKQLKQTQIDQKLIGLARSGRSVVRLKGGDPFLFGRGSEEAEALRAAGVPFEVVPGVSSALAVPAYAGISLTHRDLASSVVFLSGTDKQRQAFDMRELAAHKGTIVVLMGLKRLRTLTQQLLEVGARPPDTPVAVIEAGSLPRQRVVVGNLATIAEQVELATLGTPALAVIGQVVSLRATLSWFESKPLFGVRILVPRTERQAQKTSRAIRERGGDARELPLLRIEPLPSTAALDDALNQLSAYDLVVFTSDNAVQRFFQQLEAARLDARAFGSARIAAVGEATAQALAQRGLRADVQPAEARAEGLVSALLSDLSSRAPATRTSRVLLPRAEVARDVLPAALRAAGIEVDVVALYRTVPTGSEHRERLVAWLERGEIDVVLLLSGSMVRSLVELLDGQVERLQGVTLASIGPVTTEEAHALGLQVQVQAEKATVPALLDAVEAHVRTRVERS